MAQEFSFPELKVLIVDDVNTVRMHLKEILRVGKVINIKTVANGAEAIAAITESIFDVAIVDRHMEPLNGVELVKYIRGNEKLKHLPIIMLTAENRKEQVMEALGSGVNGYILKPVSTKQVLSEIQRVLNVTAGQPIGETPVDSTPMLDEFSTEMTEFVRIAWKALDFIKQDPLKNRKVFKVFSEKMFAVRSTAQQLGLNHIIHIATLAEEIAVKAMSAESRAQLRKVEGCLWDAMTSTKYLIENRDKKTTDEQDILVGRLEHTLKSLGGPAEAVTKNEIDQLLKNISKEI
jgi:two-component system chemotaxis response regulator CheY